MPDLGYSIFLDPVDTVRAFEARGALQTTMQWSEMMHEQHAVAFTVAKVARLDLLRSIRTSLDDVIRNGGTFEGWKANILPDMQKAGWWGYVQNEALTGTAEPIIVNERRLRTIYETNTRMSLAAGHWQRIQRQKEQFPYLRYLPSTAEHKRPLHKLWYGVILPVDHPWWQTHFPPNGWGCKCYFEQVSEARMRRKGWKVTPVADIPDGPARLFTPAVGESILVPADIDPGFSYNPGTALLQAVAEKSLRSMVMSAENGLYAAANTTLREIIADTAFDQFLAMPKGVFPVALLRPEQASLIDAKSPVVVLPSGVYQKQLGQRPDISSGHADLTVDDYRLLPEIIERAVVIAQQGDNRLIYFSDAQGRLWKAVVRQDIGKALPAIVSYHKSQPKKMVRELRDTSIVLDNRH